MSLLKFTGSDGICVTDWLQDLEIYLVDRRIDEKSYLRVLKSRLAGKAKLWLEATVQLDGDKTYDEWVKLLTKEFSLKKVGTITHLASMSPHVGEEPDAFIWRIQDYLDSIRNDFTDDLVYNITYEKLHLFDDLIKYIDDFKINDAEGKPKTTKKT